MYRKIALTMVLCVAASPLWAESSARVVKNGVIYNEPGRFAGWPANNGIWNWGDEIVVGFTLGYYKDKGGGHPIDGERPSYPQQARSFMEYRRLRVWALAKEGTWGPSGSERLLLKVGTDPRNYYLYQTALPVAVAITVLGVASSILAAVAIVRPGSATGLARTATRPAHMEG